jgi:mRNA-degrading endonuclease RelE of RelBE toxin-antitoxin system
LPDLILTRRAKQDLEALPPTVREAVLETIALIQREPEELGKRLVGPLEGYWAARIGAYRILYTIEQPRVVVRAVRHRGVVYRTRRRGR